VKKLDAAIDLLHRISDGSNEGEEFYFDTGNTDGESIECAIRLLEAAAKVDKAQLLGVLDQVIAFLDSEGIGPTLEEFDIPIRALIKALPEDKA